MNSALAQIESLRDEKSPDKIEAMLLGGKLGEIGLDKNGYQYINKLAVSWLVVEVYELGYIENRAKEVVHHMDGNPLNNIHSNLKVMKRSVHSRLHIDKYNADPKNTKAIEAKERKTSDWYKDKANAEANRTRIKALSKTKRKNWGDLSVFTKPFTIGEYARSSRVCIHTAYDRLKMLLKEDQITCEKELIGSKWCNIYRRD